MRKRRHREIKEFTDCQEVGGPGLKPGSLAPKSELPLTMLCYGHKSLLTVKSLEREENMKKRTITPSLTTHFRVFPVCVCVCVYDSIELSGISHQLPSFNFLYLMNIFSHGKILI